MPSSRFPVVELYQEQILDARTVARAGGWWTAVLLIEDPRYNSRFINLYRWQKTEDGWKTRKSFSIRDAKQVDDIVDALRSFQAEMA